MANKQTVYEALGKLSLALLDLIQAICATIFSGYVLSILWAWFVTATFGIVALNIPSAIGVMLVAGYVTKQYSYVLLANKSEEVRNWDRVMGWAKPAGALMIGWVVHNFI